ERDKVLQARRVLFLEDAQGVPRTCGHGGKAGAGHLPAKPSTGLEERFGRRRQPPSHAAGGVVIDRRVALPVPSSLISRPHFMGHRASCPVVLSELPSQIAQVHSAAVLFEAGGTGGSRVATQPTWSACTVQRPRSPTSW